MPPCHAARACRTIETMGEKDRVSEGLLRAAVETLRPIVRKLLASGIPFGQLEARLRELFVEVAQADFSRNPRGRQTLSRIALLTGINRKEVRRLRARDARQPPAASFGRNQAASLISRWVMSKATSDRRGKPRPLPYQSARGESFTKLAREVTADVSPRAILDALVESGAAEIRQGNRVVLKKASYVPELGSPEKLTMLADDPAELVEAMLHNIFGQPGEDLWLQRKVFYDNIGSDGVAKLRSALRRAGKQLMERAERTLARNDRDRNPTAPGGDRIGVGLGVYYFEKRGSAAVRGKAASPSGTASPRSRKK